jgi:hypothetical protein
MNKVCIVAIGILLVFALAGLGAQDAQTWPNKVSVPVFFEINSGTHRAQIDIDVSSGQEPAAFFITGPDGTSEALLPGEEINTDDQPPFGRNVALTGSGGNYILFVSKNYHPDDPSSPDPGDGVFTSPERWGLTIAGLPAASDIQAGSSAEDLDGNGTTSPTVLACAGAWRGNTDIPVFFKVPGSQGIHKVEVELDAGQDQAAVSFDIVIPDHSRIEESVNSADYFEQTMVGIPTAAPLNTGAADGSRDISATAEVGGVYRLTIVQNDYGANPTFQRDQYIQLTFHGLDNAADDTVQVSITAYDDSEIRLDAATAAIVLNTPPVVAITKPAPYPPQYDYVLTMNRQIGFDSVSHDELALPLDGQYSWQIDGGAPFTGKHPAYVTTFADLDSHEAALKATETVDVSTAYAAYMDGIYHDFSHSSEDLLNIRMEPSETLGIPRFLALPGDYEPPNIDGAVVYGEDDDYVDDAADAVNPDVGWRAALRITHGDGVYPAPVAFQALKHAYDPILFLSFEVRRDPTYNNADSIVVAFRPTADETDPATMDVEPIDGDLVVILHPVTDGTAGSGSATITDYQVWKRIGGSWSDIGKPTDMLMAASWYPFMGGNTWDVELQIPLQDSTSDSVDWEDFGPVFMLYYNIIRVSTDGPEIVTQYTWPRNSPNIAGALGPDALSPAEWMLATTTVSIPSEDQNGVFIHPYTDIGVADPDPDQPLSNRFILEQSNRVVARVRNGTIREVVNTGSGPATKHEGQIAELVLAHFRLANWGLPAPNNWTTIPPDDDQTEPNPSNSKDITAPTDVDQDGVFTPSMEIYAFDYTPPGIPGDQRHQCMYVELESEGNARILSKGVYRNMNFETGSEFRQAAAIGAYGYPPPNRGGEWQRFVLQVNSVERKNLSGRDPEAGSGYSSTLHYTVQGFRMTGRTLTIGKRTYEIADAVGSFGHEVSHDGDVSRWRHSLDGAEEIGEGLYRLAVPVAGEVEIEPIIRPVERRWQISFHGGTAIPLGVLANNYTPGLLLLADAGYRLRQDVWLLGLFGYNGYRGKTGVADTHWLNVSANIRYLYPANPPLSMYAGAGAGLYVEKGGQKAVGINAGLGTDLRINRIFTAEAGTDYHYIFDGAQTQFLAVQLGIVARF